MLLVVSANPTCQESIQPYGSSAAYLAVGDARGKMNAGPDSQKGRVELGEHAFCLKPLLY